MAKNKKIAKKRKALSLQDPVQLKQLKKATENQVATLRKRSNECVTKTTTSDPIPLKRSARIYSRLPKNLEQSAIKAKNDESTNSSNVQVKKSLKPRKNGTSETQNSIAVPPTKRSKINRQNKLPQNVGPLPNSTNKTPGSVAVLEKQSKKNRYGLPKTLAVLLPKLTLEIVSKFMGTRENKPKKASTVPIKEPLKRSKRISLRLEMERQKAQIKKEVGISLQHSKPSCETRSSNTLQKKSSKARSSTFKTTENQIGPSISTLDLNDEESPKSIDETFKIPQSKPIGNSGIRMRQPSIPVTSLQAIIRRRTTEVRQDSSDVYLAKKSLQVSEIPNHLPCREKEFKEIHKVIENKILDNSGGCMYVCGVPGVGKTATITAVMRSLQLQSKEKTLPPFELIQINGMQLTEPQQAYVNIWHHLTGVKVRWEEAVSLLDQFFNATVVKRKIQILVVDEFEMLKSPGERVIYKLLDWARNESARLFVVAIGNVINPVQFGGVTSRLGATRFIFRPYTQAQLLNIVLARLAGTNIFENDAVELVARKVASISGDCRRALDICRRATEIGEKDCIGKEIFVTMCHVIRAFDEMISNPKVIGIKGCSKYEKLFLQAVVTEVARTGVDETVLLQVYRQFETICALDGVPVPEPGIALRISSKLGSARLLLCEHSSNSIHQKIMLNVTENEMRYAFELN